MPTKKVYISGMHCVSCEKLLEDELKNISGIEKIRADRKKGTVELEYGKKEPEFSEIKKMVEKFGYRASEKEENPEKPKDKIEEWMKAILIILAILFLYSLFQKSGITEKIRVGNEQLTFGVAFFVGLVASVSSCLAVVGGVIIAFSEKYKAKGEGLFETAVRPNLLFHFGRLSTFFILGGILGLIGGEISLSGNFIAVFTIIIAIVMGLLGLNILGILPSISSFGLRMPKNFTGRFGKLKKSEHKFAPFILGGLTFFLPCGFTQSMQIFALTSGSFWVGGLSLLLFALGTVPALLILGITTSWTKSKKIVIFQKVAGVIIILFAIYTLQSGFALKGVKTDVLTTKKEATTENNNSTQNSSTANVQTVNMKITSAGFEPNVIKIKKGIPVKWVIDGQDVTSCTSKIIIPSLNITKSISAGENIINFTPTTSSGEIPFSCWMGMVRGKFIVE